MRVLYKILLLNLWHSIQRSRYMMPALVVAAGMLFAGGGYLALQGVQMAEKRLSSASDSRSEDRSAPSNNSFGVPKQSSLSNEPDTSSDNTKADSTASQKKPSQPSSSQQAADLKVAGIKLDPAVSVCDQSGRAYQVASATLTLAGVPSAGKTVKWYWETRVESGQAPDSGSILSGDIRTLTLSDNDQAVILTGPTASEPLISAAANSNYSYSFRLHVVGPNDISSSWVTVPTFDESLGC